MYTNLLKNHLNTEASIAKFYLLSLEKEKSKNYLSCIMLLFIKREEIIQEYYLCNFKKL